MGDAAITTSPWREVQVGRIVLIHGGPSDGKLATVVEIIDHKRVCDIAEQFDPTLCEILTSAGSD